MLGFERNEPFAVKGKFAKKIREDLYRIATGNYNRNDILSAAFQHEKSDIKIVCDNETKLPYEDILAEQVNNATSKYIVFVNPTVTFDYKMYKGLKMKLIEGYLHANYKFKNDENYYQTKYTFVVSSIDKDEILNHSVNFFKKQFAEFEKTKRFVYIRLSEVNIHDDYTSVSYQTYVENDWNDR